MTADADLLPRVARGDEEAVEQCIERYGGLIWSMASRLLRKHDDAEDAVQEIFIDIWKHADRFQPEIGSEKTFVVVIARRRLIDRQRKSGRAPDECSIDESALDHSPLDEPNPVELAEDAEQAIACLGRLRENYRRMLELAIYHGMSQTEISTAEGIPLGTVKSHARRGLSQLRHCMGLRGGSEQ